MNAGGRRTVEGPPSSKTVASIRMTLEALRCIAKELKIVNVSYNATVEKILIQLWSFFDNSAKGTAAYGKAVMAMKEITHQQKDGKKWQSVSKKHAEQNGCQ